jgi:iron complex outermembrane recepter protein
LNGNTYYTSYWDSSRFYTVRTPINRVAIVNGTMYTVDNPGAPTLRYAEKNGLKVDSTTAKDQQLGWVTLPSYTIKGGASINIDREQNVFFNAGYLTRPMRFDNVFTVAYNSGRVPILDTSGKVTLQQLDDIGLVRQARKIQNENILAFEAGYSFRNSQAALSINTYYTIWKNRPLESIVRVSDPNSIFYGEPYTLTGLDARHMGIEAEAMFKPIQMLELGLIASVGDWIWDSPGVLIAPDGTSRDIDPTGVHVGDAAQVQLGGSVRLAPIKGAYLSLRGVQFSKNYSSFNPENLSGVNARRESWQLPNYFVLDLSAGYSFKVDKTAFISWRFGINNLLDSKYIADGNNNINEIGFNAQSATVFFGQGIRWNTSLEFSF